ncbi:7-deoxyloganetin glucosyltransferase [Linum perenne]
MSQLAAADIIPMPAPPYKNPTRITSQLHKSNTQKMGSISLTQKPHAVCIPYPAQGHVTPMLNLAKLLHHRAGFHVTFVNTEYNHRRLLNSHPSAAVSDLPSFRFATIPDGLSPPPPSAAGDDVTQDIPSLCESTRRTCLPHFRKLLADLNGGGGDTPPVSCIVSDGVMSFTLDAAEELGVPEVLFWTTSACGFLGYMHYRDLIDRGYTPLKDESYLTNGYLDTVIDWIPGMKRTTNPNEFMLEFVLGETDRSRKRPSAVILNTFDALEHDVLAALSTVIVPPVYSISITSSLWKPETECLKWLDSKQSDQLVEFAWGLANSGKDFLWVIRPDLVAGETAVLPPEFVLETENRGILATWAPQEEVLGHVSVGGFLTHSGWNSTMESLCSGVPMICWPFFAEQQTNCRFSCEEWGVGMEIGGDAKRGDVEKMVRELMDGKKGAEMRRNAAEWKRRAVAATAADGSSVGNLDELIEKVLLSRFE